MIDATKVADEQFRSVGNVRLHRFTIPSIALATVGELARLDAAKAGKLLDFKIACASLDYNVSLRSKEVVTLPSVAEVLMQPSIDKVYAASEINIIYYNGNDIPDGYLYIEVDNIDAANATGVIELELIIAHM